MSHHHLKKRKKFLKKLKKRFAPELRDILMLWFVSKKPSHGYELIKKFDDLEVENLKAKANRVYPGLEKMKEKGYVESFVDTSASFKKPRKVYTLTNEGKTHLLDEIENLRNNLNQVRDYLDLIEEDIKANK